MGGLNSAVESNFSAKQPPSGGVRPFRAFSNPVYEIAPEELRPPSSQPPISLSPQPSAGTGESGSTLPIYAQPDLSKKPSHQQSLAADPYSKLATITTTSPLPVASIDSVPVYSNPDVPEVSQTQKPGIFDADYDEIACTMNLEHTNKQPASQANMAAPYDNVASDIVPKPSHQCPPHQFSHDTSSPSVNVHLVTYDEPLESRTRGESFRSNARNPAIFDDPSYATPSPSPHSSDNGNKTGQFQFSGHYEVDPHFQNQ